MKRFIALFLFCFFILFSLGCRGYRSSKPAVHLNPNFDWQPKFTAQKLALKSPEGIVPWGDDSGFLEEGSRQDYLKPSVVFYTGKKYGEWIEKAPVGVDQDFILNGKKQFDIFCSACHTKTGNGTKSQISKQGWIVPNLLDDLTQKKPDGELFDIVSHGVRSMSGYEKVISVSDRWAIVVYLRTLQKIYEERESHE